MEIDRCISFKELKTIVPYSRAHIDRLENQPKYRGDDGFPQRVRLGNCRCCWMLSEVVAWLRRRADKRKPPAP